MKVSEHRDAGRVRRANNSLRAALLRLAARRFDSISACIKRTSGKVPRTALTRRRADLQATASYDCTADRGQRVCWHLARAADDVRRASRRGGMRRSTRRATSRRQRHQTRNDFIRPVLKHGPRSLLFQRVLT